MASPYRVVLSLPGAALFSVTGTVARLPLSMVGLALVIVVERATDSYALAGTVAAAYVFAAAVMAPVQGRLLDEWGQRPVLVVSAVVYGVGMTAVVVALEAGVAVPWTHLAAALTGAATPQTGNMVRARWTHLVEGRQQLNTAYALEAVLDEVVFIVGPVLATFLTLQVSPYAGLVTAATAGCAGSLLLAGQRRTEPPVVRRRSGGRAPLDRRLLGPVVAASVGIGIVFGSTEVIVVAFTDEQGRPGTAGVVLAVWAAGSLAAGIAVGLLPSPVDVVARLRVTVTVLALTFVPLLFLDGVLLLAIGMFVAGAAISPTLVAAMHLVQQFVPPARLTEALSWTTLGLSIGVAPGAAAAGWVVDHAPSAWGASTAFGVPLLAGLLAAAVAWSFHPPPRGATSSAPALGLETP
ncbi:transporter, major facilitator family protein [Aeromicrobium marinum DSM 15272]|uniref:Transporter, major facilitator family protein n=1 Tax=Aeromicrobium marinum DSM 15272 TaxID=585531 RepID=E2SAB4_9ACTN|nr:MFS transporter [Aeromicrobium marinum]EFQ84188.1 transporter, major facilitator family protein [Aeromicrobium marinum DSM 15272]